MTRPQAYIFDVFGTLVDWRSSIARQVAPLLVERGIDVAAETFADHWRGRYDPSMAPIRDGQHPYVALDDLHRENLNFILDDMSLNPLFDDATRQEMARFWERLDPWPDVVEGLDSLKGKAIIAPCSNGSIALMVRLAKHGSLPWDCILGAELARSYKPDPKVYQACCEALRLEPVDVMMVACHNSDLAAARACGLQTGFIARPTEHGPEQTIDLSAEDDWDRIVTTIGELT